MQYVIVTRLGGVSQPVAVLCLELARENETGVKVKDLLEWARASPAKDQCNEKTRPAEFGTFLQQEIRTWDSVAKRANIRLE